MTIIILKILATWFFLLGNLNSEDPKKQNGYIIDAQENNDTKRYLKNIHTNTLTKFMKQNKNYSKLVSSNISSSEQNHISKNMIKGKFNSFVRKNYHILCTLIILGIFQNSVVLVPIKKRFKRNIESKVFQNRGFVCNQEELSKIVLRMN